MDRMEKATALMKNAEPLGIYFELKGGVIELKPVPVDEVTAMMLQDLEPYMPEIRSILERRAIAARLKELVGRRVRSTEFGDGIITSVGNDGIVAVATRPPGDSDARSLNISAPAVSLIVLPESDASSEAPSTTDESTPTPDKRSWLADLMRRSRSKSVGGEEPNRTNWWR